MALASGELGDWVSDQSHADAEAVVATQGGDGSLQVHMLDDNVAVGQVVDTSPTVVPPSIGTLAAAPRSLAVAVGDFDSDGQNNIAVLWQGRGCSVSGCQSAPHLCSGHPWRGVHPG